jgi:hypothetical protein
VIAHHTYDRAPSLGRVPNADAAENSVAAVAISRDSFLGTAYPVVVFGDVCAHGILSVAACHPDIKVAAADEAVTPQSLGQVPAWVNGRSD